MILVDSSVWIDYFNGIENEETDKLHATLRLEEVAIGDLILIEVLQGFKADKEVKIAKKVLTPLAIFEFPGLEMAIKSANNFRKLRKKALQLEKRLM